MPIRRDSFSYHFRDLPFELLLPILIGLICGLESIIIRTIIPLTFKNIIRLSGLIDSIAFFIIFAFLLFGAYITGLLERKMGEISGAGLNFAIESYHFKSGLMSWKFAPLKFLATFFTLGFGGSGGLVGPTAAIGQGTASYFSRWFGLKGDKSRIIALCGIAGCVSGLLHTPFGAAIFALELCYMGSIVYENLIPVLLSSVAAYIMSARIVRYFPFGYMLERPHLFRTLVSDSAFPWSDSPFPWTLDHLLYSIIAALFTTLLVIIFIKSFRLLHRFSETKIANVKFRPIMGAILVGIVAVSFFRYNLNHVMSESSDLVELCATGEYPLKSSIALLMGRWATTFFTVGFGGSGGLFSPTVLVGELSGTIVAHILNISHAKVLVTTGISAALAGMINVPMAAVIIVTEAFGISFIIPAAIGSAIASILAKNVVIYPNIQKFREPAKL
jgi:CIC family chloride channel protein